MVEGIRRLNLRTILGNEGNTAESPRLLDQIECFSIRKLPAGWSTRSFLPGMSSGGTDRGTDYRYYSSYTGRFIDTNRVAVALRGMGRRLTLRHPTGWAFSEADGNFVDSNADFVQFPVTLAG